MAKIANRGEATCIRKSREPFGTPRRAAREGRSAYRFGGKGEHGVSRGLVWYGVQGIQAPGTMMR